MGLAVCGLTALPRLASEMPKVSRYGQLSSPTVTVYPKARGDMFLLYKDKYNKTITRFVLQIYPSDVNPPQIQRDEAPPRD